MPSPQFSMPMGWCCRRIQHSDARIPNGGRQHIAHVCPQLAWWWTLMAASVGRKKIMQRRRQQCPLPLASPATRFPAGEYPEQAAVRLRSTASRNSASIDGTKCSVVMRCCTICSAGTLIGMAAGPRHHLLRSDQRPEKLPNRHIKGGRRFSQHAILRLRGYSACIHCRRLAKARWLTITPLGRRWNRR